VTPAEAFGIARARRTPYGLRAGAARSRETLARGLDTGALARSAGAAGGAAVV
jgi:hypothetical protein